MQEILNKILRKGKKYGEVEAVITDSETKDVIIDDNTVKRIVTGNNKVLGIRVTLGKRFGYATTTRINNWENCLLEAYNIAKASNELIIKPELPGKQRYEKLVLDKKLKQTSIDELKDLAEKLINETKQANKEITLPEANVTKYIQTTNLANSNGVTASDTNGMITVAAEAVLGDGTAYEQASVAKGKPNITKLVRVMTDLCIKSQNPQKAETRKTSVILDYFAIAPLIEDIVIPALSADNILSNKSVFKDKIGEGVCSPLLSITDNGLIKGGLCSIPFDAEGVKTQKTELIRKGGVIGFLHDSFTAKKMNTSSTGNCTSLLKRPAIGPTNIITSKGDITKQEMIKETREGVLITSILGIHQANQITGEFSLGTVNAFSIKNGEVAEPLRDCMISGNIFEMLKQIKYIGKEQRQESSVKTSPMCFTNIQVIG